MNIFRNRNNFSSKFIFLSSITTSVILIVIGLHLNYTHGIPSRIYKNNNLMIKDNFNSDLSTEDYNENTRKYKQEINDEMKRVIIHGCLHLVGFNDSTEKEKIYMREKEQEYINSLGEDIII